jgi:hypothetical protein
MNEEERANRFARALDEFLSGGSDQPPPGLDDQDLTSLFDVASRRLDRSGSARDQAALHESDVWERLLDRLSSGDDEGDTPSAPDLGDDSGSREMMDVIGMRRRISEDALALAEQHRYDVWEKVRQRLEEDSSTRSPLVIEGDVADLDDLPAYEPGDPAFDSLVRISLGAAHAPPRDPEMTVRLWSRVGGFPDHSELEKSLEERWSMTNIPASITAKAVGIAAGLALLVAAVGPIPTTGFAEHPFVEGAKHLAGETGVIETTSPPPVPETFETDAGRDVTTAEAASILHLPVAEPAYVPARFELVSSKFHRSGIASSNGGVFSLEYESRAGNAALVIYQEPATGADIAAQDASTMDAVVGGWPATYFEGGWQSQGGSLAWSDGDSQSLVFEPAGLRVLVQYSGPKINAFELLSVADSMKFD